MALSACHGYDVMTLSNRRHDYDVSPPCNDYEHVVYTHTRSSHQSLNLLLAWGTDLCDWVDNDKDAINQSINQSINTFITRHGTEVRATVRIMPKQREMS